jgi:DNA adenine methylase
MNPIIKWPGGKRRELSVLRPLFPTHRRLVEPFAGGAAVFCALEPPAALLNDLDPDLIALYARIGAGEASTTATFRDLTTAWNAVLTAGRAFAPVLAEAYRRPDFTAAGATPHVVGAVLSELALQPTSPFLPRVPLRHLLGQTVTDKLKRLRALEAIKPVPEADLREQLATAVIAAFYTFIRDQFVPSSPDEAVAAFWFLRETCYGSLNRYNQAGRFNVPYGGASYNDKDLAGKVETLLSPATVALFARATLSCLDFRDFFAAYGAGSPGDFVFLDPPYDSKFSSYGARPFNAAAQAALAEIVSGLSAPTALVIRRTPFIEALYRDRGLTLATYSRTYGVNIRSRFARAAEHLLVLNYALPTSVGLTRLA